eukprot:gene366-1362_t
MGDGVTQLRQRLERAALPCLPSESSLENDFGGAVPTLAAGAAWESLRAQRRRIVGAANVTCRESECFRVSAGEVSRALGARLLLALELGEWAGALQSALFVRNGCGMLPTPIKPRGGVLTVPVAGAGGSLGRVITQAAELLLGEQELVAMLHGKPGAFWPVDAFPGGWGPPQQFLAAGDAVYWGGSNERDELRRWRLELQQREEERTRRNWTRSDDERKQLYGPERALRDHKRQANTDCGGLDQPCWFEGAERLLRDPQAFLSCNGALLRHFAE